VHFALVLLKKQPVVWLCAFVISIAASRGAELMSSHPCHNVMYIQLNAWTIVHDIHTFGES
jgi:hypothetical protein